MPGKTRAKERLDKFYNLAKETGYRSRAAFKLVQINRKYDFLSKCRTVVDLCGAPGSWSQVCAKTMPKTSTIVCVDLVKIAPIPGVKCLQGDITSEKTQAKVRQLLEKKRCECVIHDGAPNVGGTWDKDAFAQNWLTLKATQFACNLLQPDGWFITKVFRSRDFTRLLWVLSQLFDKVEQFKPAASRQQSAEVFVICAGFRAPRKLDPKLFSQAIFDPSIEDEQQVDAKDPIGRIAAKNKSKVPQGYEDGRMLLYKRGTAGELFESDDPKQFLETYNEIYFEEGVDDHLRDHRLTNQDLKECFKDLKVISKWDQNNIVKWIKRIKLEMQNTMREAEEAEKEARRLAGADDGDADDEDEDPDRIMGEIEAMKKRDAKSKKRLERKLIDRKLMQAERVGYNPEDHQDEGQQEVFQFSKQTSFPNALADVDADDYDENADVGADAEIAALDIHARDQQGRDTVMDVDGDDDDEDEEAEDSDSEGVAQRPEKEEKDVMTTADYYQNMERVLEKAFRGRQEYSDDDEADGDEPAATHEKWIDSSEECDSSSEGADDDDSDSIARERGVGGAEARAQARKRRREDSEPEQVQTQMGVQQLTRMERKDAQKKEKKRRKKNLKGGFEEVPAPMLDPETRARTLAIATQMLDRKRKREVLEDGIHRWAFAGDEELPRWFVEDERLHHVRHLPVSKQEVDEQKARFRELNARPSKKVAEAVARRRRRAASKLKSILVKEKNDPRMKGTSQGLTVRKLMRSQQMRWKGKEKHQKADNRSKAEKRLAKKRERFNKKKSGRK